jgi:uncharacterized protein VirK/YbjX
LLIVLGRANDMLIGKLLETYGADLRMLSPVAATVRMARLLRRFPVLRQSSELLESASAKAHQQLLNKADPFFALAHKYYLSKNLTAQERLSAAESTYRFIDQRFCPEAKKLIAGTGYKLWEVSQNEHTFDLRLMLGNDNIYEGGLSAVFHFDSKRVGVMSFAVVDGTILGSAPGPAIWICRNQTTSDRFYQKPLQDAFKQIALPYMMLACLAGIGRGLGLDAIHAITEEVHPHNLDPEAGKLMAGSYSQFWTKYFAIPTKQGIVSMKIPLETTPLDQVSGNHRRRAKGRREVMENVSAETARLFAAGLIEKPETNEIAEAPISPATPIAAGLVPSAAMALVIAKTSEGSALTSFLHGLM